MIDMNSNYNWPILRRWFCHTFYFFIINLFDCSHEFSLKILILQLFFNVFAVLFDNLFLLLKANTWKFLNKKWLFWYRIMTWWLFNINLSIWSWWIVLSRNEGVFKDPTIVSLGPAQPRNQYLHSAIG